LFTTEGRSKVKTILVNKYGELVETDIDRLIDSEGDTLVEIGTEFDCLVEELKSATGEPESETTSKWSYCNNQEEAFNNLMPEYFSLNHTFCLIIIFCLT